VTPRQRALRPEIIAGQRRRAKRRERRRRRRRRTLVILIVVAAAALAALAASFGGAAAMLDRCNLSSLQPVSIGQNSFVYDSKGRQIGSIPAEKNRQPVALRDVSTWIRKATIAIEDRRFYRHGGVDWEGILRAAVKDIEAGRPVQGASTITQQLVRNLYPISSERTFDRKVKEACLAIKLSRKYSKDWILTEYLNAVYYGNHAYGVQAAAQTYFSRKARTLGLPEAALLAGLPQAPSDYDPFARRADAMQRRNQVLRAMLDNGDISVRQYRQAVATPLKLVDGRRLYDIRRVAPRDRYFFNYVYDELVAQYGASTVRSGGLSVYTTMDRRLQRAAEQAVKKTLYYRTDPAAAVVAIDPKTGAIRAMTAEIPGGKSRTNQFNLASQARRQAGSTFKTFVLTQAVFQGIDPSATYYLSAPLHYQPDPYTACPEGCWDVSTYDHSYSGSISIETATLKSDNTVYARLTLDVGPEKVAHMAHALGIRTSLPPFPSMGLGSIAVSPLEMASAYATLAAGGVYSQPTGIRKVVLADETEDTDAGWGVPVRRRVIPDWVAAEVTRILQENIQEGTGVGAAFGRPAAGKTGTTEDHNDAWFCGYTPRLTTAVWVGYPKAEIPMLNVHGIAVAGGTFPADIFKLFMTAASTGTPYTEFPEAKTSPVWHYWRGQYQYQGGYYESTWSSSGETPATTSTTQTTTTPAPAQPAPPQAIPARPSKPSPSPSAPRPPRRLPPPPE
jgi:penicillin-binding protein 1A